MSEWGQRLRDRGKELGISEASVARKAGIEPRTYSNYVNEHREPDYETLMRICGVLRMTPNEVFGVDEMSPATDAQMSDFGRPTRLPEAYVGLTTLDLNPGMGGQAVSDEFAPESLTWFPPSLIRQLRANEADLRVMEVEGPSMAPVLENGDQVIVNTAKRNPSQPAIFVLWDGFGVVCKWVERIANTDPPKIRISSENPRFQPYEATISNDPDDGAEAIILGRVVWFARQI